MVVLGRLPSVPRTMNAELDRIDAALSPIITGNALRNLGIRSTPSATAKDTKKKSLLETQGTVQLTQPIVLHGFVDVNDPLHQPENVLGRLQAIADEPSWLQQLVQKGEVDEPVEL